MQLSERLQLEPELTLQRAEKLIRQRQAVKEQQVILKQPANLAVPQQLDRVTRPTSKAPSRKQYQKRSPQIQRQLPTQPSWHKCKRCGKGSHPREHCPARDATCYRCNRKGHYKAQCLSKTISELTSSPTQDQESDTYSDVIYLNIVNEQAMVTPRKTSWNVEITIVNKKVLFKVDTGAEVTAMSNSAWESKRDSTGNLAKSKQQLHGPDHQPLTVLGTVNLTMMFNGRSTIQRVFIVKNLRNNLLGLPAITELQLIQQHQIDVIQRNIPDQFPELFTGLGSMKEPYTIRMKPDAKPYSIYTPRNIPLPLRQKVQGELKRMESLGVISKVDTPTPWCAGMVVVPKGSGAVRICVDLKPLNENVLREVHPLPKVETTLAQLSGARVFSKLDVNSGFWQIPLDPESKLLTTFLTPFGRYCYNKLPFGISSAPEHFQRRMNNILTGLPGILCHVDDILVYGKDQTEHDTRLMAALKAIQKAGLTLNREKCRFNQTCISFLGHIINSEGISQDPQKTVAITKMAQPTCVTQLRRFLGMINQMGKFSPNLAQISQPLRDLLSKKNSWIWERPQQEAFEKLKTEVTTTHVLHHYDVNARTKISADASSYGLGAVILQFHKNKWQPIAFASRSLNETECRYAQIEKEALAITWACERFSEYILGKEVELETDHKPLVPLLGSKHLDSLPPRVLRFRLRLMRFRYNIKHVPGKELYIPDTLSRAPVNNPADHLATDDIELYVQTVVQSLPADKDRLNTYREAQANDAICSRLIDYCKSGWPNKSKLRGEIKKYWQFAGELSLHDDLLLYESRIVVPDAMRLVTLQKIHQGHQGIQKCRLRVNTSVWWPGVSKDVENFVKSCPDCQKSMQLPREPLIQSPLPSYPWEKVASDLFEFKKRTYILVVDYFSRYVEIQQLSSTTSTTIVTVLKSLFARHGVPTTLVTDNGPQYVSQEMNQFSATYGFNHITSSPYYAQSNGLAERTVKTVKNLLSSSPDPFLALLSYRATPLPWCGLSPAELLMGRVIRTDVPQNTSKFHPEWSYLT